MKKNKSKILYLSLLSIFLFGVMYVSYAFIPQANAGSSEDIIKYQGNVCVSKNGELVGCSHNLLFNNGKDQIKYVIGSGQDTGAITNLALCNANSTYGCGEPVAGASELFTSFNDCGLANATGTYASNAVGNWSVSKTFTATCDNVLTNATRIMNSSASPFAGNNFSLVTLQTNDQLTINWTISVS